MVIALAQCTFLLYYNPVLVSPGTLAAEPCVVCTRLITYFQYSVHYFILDSKAVRTQVRICGPLVPFVNKNRTLCHFYRVPSRTPRRRQLTPASRRRGRIAHRSPPCPRPRVLESRQTQSPGRSRGCRASQSGLQPYVTRAATIVPSTYFTTYFRLSMSNANMYLVSVGARARLRPRVRVRVKGEGER